MAKNLTEKQEKFLDLLFGEARGSAAEAKKLAGYATSMPSTTIVSALEEEIADRTKKMIASLGPKAAFAMLDVLENPTGLGNKDRITVAKDFLDRAGFKPQEKVEIKSETPLFILPPKESNNDEDEDTST